MTAWTTAGPTVLASFLASMVEFVEALTIVLAVGLTRGWKPALLGTAAGVAVLAGLVLALGSSLSAVPLPVLQLVVGVLLLMFGLRWLHKAVLRAAGVIPLHDEARAFARQTQALRSEGGSSGPAIDVVAFMTTFKAVVLEGIEVVFVVIALGVKGNLLLPATAGALLALLLVVALGLWLHRPLSSVPENTLKFSVGIMLTAFGTYWAGEGIGLAWPGQDVAILLLIAVFLALGAVLVKICVRLRAAAPAASVVKSTAAAKPPGGLALVGGELLGLFVEDLWLAVGVLAWVGACAWLVQMRHPAPAAFVCAAFTAGLATVLGTSAMRRAQAA
jgi:uncharacterized membrane protein